MKKLFGTDGIRGEAGVFPLDVATIEVIGASLAKHLSEKLSRQPTIIIGRDTRESGEWIEAALTRAASRAGATVHLAGVITTPGVAYLTRAISADAGLVISASHNEFRDNGIKIFSPTGQKIDESVEARIEADIHRQVSLPDSAVAGQVVGSSAADLQNHYLTYLTTEIGNALSLKGLNLTVDCANGAASQYAPKLFQQLAAEVQALNCAPDGRNINLNCGSLHMEGLQQAVRTNSSNIGVAFDGDADRALFVDEGGNFIDGDATMWVLANYMQQRRELLGSTVVATVMSNIGLEIALGRIGVELTRTDVGDKYVLDELLRSGASLGGEQSGHIIFPRISLAGDGMITALSLLRVMVDTGMPLSLLAKDMERYPQILLNVRVREKIPFNEISSLPAAIASVESELDGHGRLLLRYSGTESLARIMIEGRDASHIKRLAESLAEVIKRGIGT